MIFDMGAVITQAMREEEESLRKRMDNLLALPLRCKVLQWPELNIEVVLDPTVPSDTILFQRDGVTVGRIINLQKGTDHNGKT